MKLWKSRLRRGRGHRCRCDCPLCSLWPLRRVRSDRYAGDPAAEGQTVRAPDVAGVVGRVSTAEPDPPVRLPRSFRAGRAYPARRSSSLPAGEPADLLRGQERDAPSPTRWRRIHYLQGQYRRHQFPSGHVINYIGVYGTLAVILSHRLKSTFLRRLVIAFVGLKIALVGPSRIYLGHHWFTDVLTSYLLGSSYIVLLNSVYKRVARRRHER